MIKVQINSYYLGINIFENSQFIGLSDIPNIIEEKKEIMV